MERAHQEGNKSIVYYSLFGVQQDIAEKVVNEAISKAPLSKYEIEPLILYLNELNVAQRQNMYYYSITNSHSYMRGVEYSDPCVRVISPIKVDLNEKDYE